MESFNTIIIKVLTVITLGLAVTSYFSIRSAKNWKKKYNSIESKVTIVIKTDTIYKDSIIYLTKIQLVPKYIRVTEKQIRALNFCDSTRYYVNNYKDSIISIDFKQKVVGKIDSFEAKYSYHLPIITTTVTKEITTVKEVEINKRHLYIGGAVKNEASNFKLGGTINYITKNKLNLNIQYYPKKTFIESEKSIGVGYKIF